MAVSKGLFQSVWAVAFALSIGSFANAATSLPKGEYAAYSGKNSASTVIVIRDKGDVQLWNCSSVFPEGVQDPASPQAVKEFAKKECGPLQTGAGVGLKTSVETSYITGHTQAVFSIAQVYQYPANSAEPGELGSVMSTFAVNTYAGNPVGANDTVAYVGAKIVHDHDATPRLSSVRITYELVAVTRATL